MFTNWTIIALSSYKEDGISSARKKNELLQAAAYRGLSHYKILHVECTEL